MSIGYPDYSRTQAEAGNQLGGFFGQKGNDPATSRMNCVGYSNLTIAIDDAGNVHNYTVVVTFYDDFGLTNIIGTRTLTPVPGTRFPYQVPVISRYAIVTCSHITFADPENIGCLVYGSNIPVINIGDAQGGQPFIHFSGNVNAGIITTISALYVHEGPATLHIDTSSGSSYYIIMNYFDLATAAFVRLLVLYGANHGQDVTTRVSLPPCPVQVVFANQDAAARTMTVSVTLG